MSEDNWKFITDKEPVGTIISPVFLTSGKINIRNQYKESNIIGRLLCFLHGNNPVLSQVVDVITYNPYIDPKSYLGKGNMGFVSDHGKIPHTDSSDMRFADINFLHMLSEKTPTNVKNSPSTGLDIFEANDEIFKKFYPFNFPKTISLGKYTGTGSDLPIDVDEIKNTHCAIFGKTGWGKSVLQSFLAALLTKTGSKILIIDHTGDYSSSDKLVGKIFKELVGDFKNIQAKKIRADYDLLRIRLNDDLFWNRLLATNLYYLKNFISNVMGEIMDVYQEDELNIIDDDRFIELVKTAIPLTFSQTKASQKFKTIDTREREIRNWFNRTIKPLLERPITYNDICSLFTANKVVVIDFSGQDLSTNEKCLYTYKIAQTIYEKAKEGYEETGDKFDIVFIVDEAHNYVPEEIAITKEEHNWQTRSKKILITLAKEGRKYGTAICLADQRIASVDKDAIDLQTFFLGKLQLKTDKDHVKTMFGEGVLNIVDALNLFEFVVVGGANPLGDNGSPIRVYDPLKDIEYVKKLHTIK